MPWLHMVYKVYHTVRVDSRISNFPQCTLNKLQSCRKCGMYGNTIKWNVTCAWWHKCDYWKTEAKDEEIRLRRKNTVYIHWSMFTGPVVSLSFMRHSYVGHYLQRRWFSSNFRSFILGNSDKVLSYITSHSWHLTQISNKLVQYLPHGD